MALGCHFLTCVLLGYEFDVIFEVYFWGVPNWPKIGIILGLKFSSTFGPHYPPPPPPS